MPTTQDIEAGIRPGGIGPVDISGPPQPLDLPPYYVAAPGMPSQPTPIQPVEQPQIVDRQAYWLQQYSASFEETALAAQRQPDQPVRFPQPQGPTMEAASPDIRAAIAARDAARGTAADPFVGNEPLPGTTGFLDAARSFDDLYAQKAAKLAAGLIPGPDSGGNQSTAAGVIGEFARPSSIAAMFVPLAKGPVAARVIQNALRQGGANVAIDLLLGRTDPKQLALSAGAGAALGGGLPELGTSLAAIKRYGASPEGKAALARLQSERGEMKLPGGEESKIPDGLPERLIPLYQKYQKAASLADEAAFGAGSEQLSGGLPPQAASFDVREQGIHQSRLEGDARREAARAHVDALSADAESMARQIKTELGYPQASTVESAIAMKAKAVQRTASAGVNREALLNRLVTSADTIGAADNPAVTQRIRQGQGWQTREYWKQDGTWSSRQVGAKTVRLERDPLTIAKLESKVPAPESTVPPAAGAEGASSAENFLAQLRQGIAELDARKAPDEDYGVLSWGSTKNQQIRKGETQRAFYVRMAGEPTAADRLALAEELHARFPSDYPKPEVPSKAAPGAEGAAVPAAGAPAAGEPPREIPGGLLSEQGDVIRLTRKGAPAPYELNPLLRHYPEQQLAPEAANLDKPVIGEGPAPRLQPALGLLDEQGNIIDPLDPTASLVRQAFGGDAPTLPPDVSIPGVQEWKRTWNEYATQLADSRQALNDAVNRRKELAALYDSPEQRAIRTAQKAAVKQGLMGDVSSAIPKSVLDEARSAVTAARKANDAAKEAMRTAHIRVVDEDIARRLEAVGVDRKVIKDVQAQFHISQLEQGGEADFLTMAGWRKRWEQVYNRFGGNLSGPVGASARRAMNLNSGLNVWVNDFAQNYLKPMQKLLDQNAKTLRFVGDTRYSGLADTHRLWYVFTHPEDFRGISPAMHKLLNQAEAEGKAFYQGVRQFDPLNTAKPVSGRYLPQMWEDGIDHVERFGHARGKAFITKQRAWKDWREAILSEQWSKELAEMTPGQALEYAHRAAAQQMSDFYMRRDVLRRFGSRTQRPGDVAFNAPMYRGWYGKPEIVSQVDAFFQPASDLIKPLRTVLQPIKNMRYGVDFAIWGYNVLHTLAGGNVQIAAGLLERALHGSGLRTIGDFADEGVMIQHGLAARGLESPFHKGGATPLSWIPPLRGIDSKLTQGLDWLQHEQYSNIMGPLRHLVAQGNVAIERATGDLTPSKMARAMDNANAITGTSRGAQRTGRAFTESTILGSARITRSQIATLGQLVKIGTPETIATLASYGVTIGAVGLALDQVFGDGRGYTFTPFSLKDGKLEYNSEWATVSIKGRRYGLIPQAALARAIAKSMAAASQMDPNAFSTAWAQYGYTRVTPGGQGAISATTGAGFAPGKGFSPFGGLDLTQRGLALAPIPVAGTSQLESSQRGVRPGIESTLGLTSYSSIPSEFQQKSAAKGQILKQLDSAGLPTREQPYQDAEFRAALSKAFGVTSLPKSYEEFRAARIDEAVKSGVPRSEAVRRYQANPFIQKLDKHLEAAMIAFWRTNPDLLKQAIETGVTDSSAEKIKILAGAR